MTTGRPKDPPGPPPQAPGEDELLTADDLFGDLVDVPATVQPVAPPATRHDPIKVQLREPGSAGKPRSAPDEALPEEMAALLTAFDVAPSPAPASPVAAVPPPPPAPPTPAAPPAPKPPITDPAPKPTVAPAEVAGFDSADLLDGLFGDSGATPAPPPAPVSPPVAAKPAPAPPPPASPPAKAPRAATPEVDRMLAGVLGSVDKPTSRTAARFSVAAPAAPLPSDGGLDLLSLAADAFGAPVAPKPRLEPPAPPPPAATEGSSFGPYVLLGKIAMGGMAEVFLAKRPGVEGFEKVLAIKRILPHLSDNQEFVSMFVDEAKMVSGLSHPNVVQIFELGKLEHSYFIAMEYVHGRDLRTIQKRAREKDTPVPVGLAMLITARVAAALEFAHRKKDEKGQPLQIVHRDISPQNILISFEGDVKLTDFGIAKAAAKASTTDRGALRGKLLYMSPEQAWGKPVDRRSDVFSLGVVFYELLTGRKPWAAAQDVSVLEMVRKSEITPLRDVNPKVPPSLAAVAMKALERNHEHRYQDASEFLQDLERTLRNVPVTPADLARFMRQLFDDQERGEVEAQAENAAAGAGPAVEVDTNPTGNQGPRHDEEHTAPSVPRDPAAIQRFLKNFGIK